MRITDEAVKAASNYIALGIDKSSAPQAIAENALAAALPHLQADYAVKQLEWGKLLYTEDYSFMQNAETSIGKYVATDSGWFLQGQSDWNGADCIETAKAAAQADFERRVCECIVGGVDVVAVREQALEEAAGLCEISAKVSQEQLDREQDRAVRAALRGEVVASNVLAKRIRALSAQPALKGHHHDK